MMGCNMKKIVRKIFLLLVVFCVAFACTEVDESVGLGYVPEYQESVFAQDSVSGFHAFVTVADSMASSNFGSALMGAMYSETFGYTNASSLIQFLPTYFDDDYETFGTDPRADSILIFLYLNNYAGTKVETYQEFEIYKVTTELELDTTAYSNFDPTPYIATEPMFDFVLTDTSAHFAKLNPLNQDGLDYMQKLLDTDESVCDDEEDFLTRFYGIYIKPKVETADHQMFSIELANSYLTVAGVTYDDDDDPTAISDTIYVSYNFTDDEYSYAQSIVSISHDFTGTPFESVLNDTTATSTPLEVSYVQSLVGVVTYLRVLDSFIDDLNALKVHDGVEYNNIVINKAELYIDMQTPTIPMMNVAAPRFGMFYDYVAATNIPDYLYLYEDYGYSIDYGGYLNRATGYYVMDISTYVQQLLVEPETQRTIFLTPAIEYTYTLNEVIINTPTDLTDPNRMNVKLSYTLTK